MTRIVKKKLESQTRTVHMDTGQREEDHSNYSVIVLDFPFPVRLSLCYRIFVGAPASCLPNEVIVFPYQL